MKETPPNCSQPGVAPLPECFGDGDKVCPVDEEGIMQPQSGCIPCVQLRACMRSVLVKRGKLRIIEDAPAKVAGFLKRWSDRKLDKG